MHQFWEDFLTDASEAILWNQIRAFLHFLESIRITFLGVIWSHFFNSLLTYDEVHTQHVIIFKHKFCMIRLCTFMRMRCRVPWWWQHKPWCTHNWVQHIWLSNVWGISTTPWGFPLSSYKDRLIQHMAGLHEKRTTDPLGQSSNGHDGSYRLAWSGCKSINLRNAVKDGAAECALSRVVFRTRGDWHFREVEALL